MNRYHRSEKEDPFVFFRIEAGKSLVGPFKIW